VLDQNDAINYPIKRLPSMWVLEATHYKRAPMECVIETKASTIVQFIDGLRGDLHPTNQD
jgi:hypothetical protein